MGGTRGRGDWCAVAGGARAEARCVVSWWGGFLANWAAPFCVFPQLQLVMECELVNDSAEEACARGQQVVANWVGAGLTCIQPRAQYLP